MTGSRWDSAYEGEELTVYVGAPGKKAGDNTDLTLVATQYHGEAASWSREIGRAEGREKMRSRFPAVCRASTWSTEVRFMCAIPEEGCRGIRNPCKRRNEDTGS